MASSVLDDMLLTSQKSRSVYSKSIVGGSRVSLKVPGKGPQSNNGGNVLTTTGIGGNEEQGGMRGMRRNSSIRNNLAAKAREISEMRMRAGNEDCADVNKQGKESNSSGSPALCDDTLHRSDTIKRFLRANHAVEDKDKYFGYMFAVLDKDEKAPLEPRMKATETEEVDKTKPPLYKGGETIKGTLFFELRQSSLQHEIYVRLQGSIAMPQ